MKITAIQTLVCHARMRNWIFVKVETEEDPKQLELDAAQVTADGPALQQNYGLPSLQHLE